ncbi:cell shape-determining protein MreB [Actinoplanes sp. NPDC051633]|uniref:cell shape-determining protein MreB n=1 Tax=Actinoplanes sp. NPDC051633 TaxID=3155670 RepID=UPI003412B6B6
MPANLVSSRPAARNRDAALAAVTPPTAIAVDLGSSAIGVWAAHRGTITGPCRDAPASAGASVRRGSIVDVDGCIAQLSELARRYAEPVPAGGVLVACRPVLAGASDQAAMRRVIDAVFAPSLLQFIDTVRAAAIGSGAAAGTLLIADVGAQVSELALLKDGHVIAARRSDLGTGDLALGATTDLLSEILVRHVNDLLDSAVAPDLTVAMTRGLLLVGDGASYPELSLALSTALRLRIHRASAPRTAALNGAGLAAMSLLRHPRLSRPGSEPTGGPR